MARLSVDLNRDGLHQIAAPAEFETDGPFEIRLRNHGEAIHVHLNLDEELAAVASLGESNHYVAPYSRRSIEIETRGIDTPVTGRLKTVTSYGAESAYTTVTVSPPGTVTERVTVDEELAKPQRSEPEPSTPRERLAAAVGGGVSPRVAAVGTLAVCAGLAVAALAENSAVFLGSLTVIAAVVAALAITRRS
ncbi:DUF7524 family protein [Halohasta litorea]|uniref:Uncharacterized protein n=1 Tax=Halohasta litorea TaxID=869891 RepID=A0ABD6D4Y5_9EURY|nr:hypothetical protein [Halohasta litorea]